MKSGKIEPGRILAASLLCAIIGWSPAGYAAPQISRADLAGIASAVASALHAAKSNLPANATEAQIDSAVASAIAVETKNLIAKYNSANPMTVAEAVIAVAMDDGATPLAIGRGLADAALAEAPAVGIQIADAIGSTAPDGAAKVFEAVTNNAGSALGASLTSAAESYEEIGAGSSAGRSGNNASLSFSSTGGPSGNGTGSGGGCRNPSCT